MNLITSFMISVWKETGFLNQPAHGEPMLTFGSAMIMMRHFVNNVQVHSRLKLKRTLIANPLQINKNKALKYTQLDTF